MTNEERRAALARARRNAVDYAEESQKGGWAASPDKIAEYVARATMWAHVANALKDGSPDHDAVNDNVHLEIR